MNSHALVRFASAAALLVGGCGPAPSQSGAASTQVSPTTAASGAEVSGEAELQPAGGSAPSAGSQVVESCDPARAHPPHSYDELAPDPDRFWTLDVRFDASSSEWIPASPLPMPLHHASRIVWIDEPPHDELAGARERLLRITFVVVDRRLAPSTRPGVSPDATYDLDVVAVCEPTR